MKKISIVIPTYNEEKNIKLLVDELQSYLKNQLCQYDYEILIIDNCSRDKTQYIVRNMAVKDKNIKAIFNARNFGGLKSPYYGMLQTTGDCTILLCADFQDPIELIGDFIKEWEMGFKIVIGKKTRSKENKFMYFLRKCYYKLMESISTDEQISQFTGFGLYDKDFIEILKCLHDPSPYLRGIVASLGYERKEIEYVQSKRLYGKTSTNFMHLYDVAMLGITSSSKVMMRIATMMGFMFSAICLVVALVYFIFKLLFWNDFQIGMAPMVMGTYLLGSIQLFFIGLLGEYILNINERVINRPLVIEAERINFE